MPTTPTPGRNKATTPTSAKPGARKPLNQLVLQEVALRCFMEVVRAGSVTEAASRLDVAPSAVSRQIGRLERELDTLLFKRKARGMTPNAAGELLAAHARRAWLDIERVTGEILGLKGVRTGEVRVAATEGFAYEFLPSMMVRFQKKWPGIQFVLDMHVQAEVARNVREGKADIGVTVSLSSEHGLKVEHRHPAPILAVMASGHPMASRRQLSLAQVTAYPLALPAQSSTLRQLLDVSCSRQGLVCDTVMTSNHLYPLINYVSESQAITFCGEAALRRRLSQGDITAVPLRDREMTERHFEVQTLAGRHLPEAARAFVAFLDEEITSEEGGAGKVLKVEASV
jgi:DNA-binding transcriptional LysR family regulator